MCFKQAASLFNPMTLATGLLGGMQQASTNKASKAADKAQAAINAEAQAIKDQAAKKRVAKAPTQTIFAGNLSEGVTLGQ